MVIQPTNYIIPDDIAVKLASGELIRWSGVVRDRGGRIVAHLKEAKPEQYNEQSGLLAQKASAALKNRLANLKGNRPAVITIAVTAIGAAIAGGIAIHSHTRKKKAKIESFEELNSALSDYMWSIERGKLDLNKIDAVILAIDRTQVNLDTAVTKKGEENELLANLLAFVRDYTEKLRKANDNLIGDVIPLMQEGNGRALDELREYLSIQRQIFEIAA